MPAGSYRGGSGGDFTLRLDPEAMGLLLRGIKQFDRELGKATVRRLKAIAEPAKTKVQQRIRSGTSHSNTGLRQGLAAGTKVSVRAGARKSGVLIQTTAARLPAGKKAMVRAYDKPSFRHPVYGHRDRWVTQRGRPYFGTTLNPLEAQARVELEQALVDAAATMTSERLR